MKSIVNTGVLSIFLLVISSGLTGQEKRFSVRLSADTISIDQTLKVEFEITNINGVFTPPDFSAFRIISGPNTSSSFSMINGNVTQKMSYTYLLKALNSGNQIIGSAFVKTENDNFESEEIEIVILENQDTKSTQKSGTQRTREYKSDMKESVPDKPKRKIRKI